VAQLGIWTVVPAVLFGRCPFPTPSRRRLAVVSDRLADSAVLRRQLGANLPQAMRVTDGEGYSCLYRGGLTANRCRAWGSLCRLAPMLDAALEDGAGISRLRRISIR